MPDNTTSVFDDTPEPSAELSTKAEKPAGKDRSPFKLGILLVLAGHLIALLAVMVGMFGQTGAASSIKDVLSAALLSAGIVFAFVQWLYGVPLVLVGLGIGIAKQQWVFLLGVLLVLAVSFALAFPLCGFAVFAGSM